MHACLSVTDTLIENACTKANQKLCNVYSETVQTFKNKYTTKQKEQGWGGSGIIR